MHIVWFHLCDILANLRDREQTGGCQEQGQGPSYKGAQGNLRGDETVLYLDCEGGGYMTINICQNSSNYIPKRMNFTVSKNTLILKLGKAPVREDFVNIIHEMPHICGAPVHTFSYLSSPVEPESWSGAQQQS